MLEDAPLLTRRQAVELIRSELGVPLGLSKIEKDAMDGRGPRPRARYGRHFLYDRADVLDYGRSLIERVPAHDQRGGHPT